MKKVEITLSFDEEKLEALEFVLRKEKTTVKKKLDEALVQLYEQSVPEPVREYLESNGYNSKLIDVFDTSDFDRFKGSVDALAQIEPRIKGTLTTRGVTTAHPPACQGPSIDAQLAEIFKPKI